MTVHRGSPFADELGAIPFENPQSPVITHTFLGIFQPGCASCTSDFAVTNGPVTWSISAGALPTGFTIGDGFAMPSGMICGTADSGDAGSTFSFTIRATNGAGLYDEWATSLSIGAWIAPNIDETSPLTSPTVAGDFYFSQVFDETNLQCNTWSIVSGSLPPGLVLETGFPTGDIDGTPTTGGIYDFTVRDENPAGFDEVAFEIVVVDHVWVGSDPTTYSQTSAFEIGTNVFVTTSVQIFGVRIWNPGLGARTSRSAKLWEMAGTSYVGGTKVREVTLPDQLPTGWSEYLFSSPYTAITTKYFIVSYDVGGFGLNDIGHVTQSTQYDSADGKVHFASNPGSYTSSPDTTPAINFINEFWGIDVLYLDSGGGGGTATPTAISLAATTPAPTASGSSSTTPAAIARTVVVPAPTATGGSGGGGTATPAAVTLAAITPAPTASGSSSTTPAAIALAATVPAPSVFARPANDNFADAIALSNGIKVTKSRDDATAEGGETGTATLWWKFTTTDAGPVSVNTIGSTYDTVLRVYTGASIGTLSLIASDDDSGGSFTSLLSFAGAAATTYYVQVSNGAFFFMGSSITVQATWPISAVTLAVVVPAPTVTGGGTGDGFALPAAITRTVVVPAPTASGTTPNGTAFPTAITLAATVPAPTATGGANGTATPATIALHATVPAPTATGTVGAVLAATWGPMTGVTVASVSARIEAVLAATW